MHFVLVVKSRPAQAMCGELHEVSRTRVLHATRPLLNRGGVPWTQRRTESQPADSWQADTGLLLLSQHRVTQQNTRNKKERFHSSIDVIGGLFQIGKCHSLALIITQLCLGLLLKVPPSNKKRFALMATLGQQFVCFFFCDCSEGIKKSEYEAAAVSPVRVPQSALPHPHTELEEQIPRPLPPRLLPRKVTRQKTLLAQV